jgi:DNA-binding XRE family transcriptional regulator
MGIVIRFPRRHARAPSTSTGCRAAKAVSPSALRPAAAALSVAKTADHHSAGTLSRCHHLETVDAPAPMSAAMASREGQSSMMDRNEANSVMSEAIGRSVLAVKPKTSHDAPVSIGHNVLMTAEEVRRGFVQRTREARIATGLSQPKMAKELGIDQGTYKNYETIRPLPTELVPIFCEICEISPAALYPPARKRTRRTG